MPRGSATRTSLLPEEAKDLAVRVVGFKKERGPLHSINPIDPWEKRMAEVAADFVRFKDESRYRVNFDNGTESGGLFRSFQRALYKDEGGGRRINEPTVGPLFADMAEDSLSTSPFRMVPLAMRSGSSTCKMIATL